ncbi:MAG: hypothetical protein ACOC0P_07040 [Planctomycetota bacterium]
MFMQSMTHGGIGQRSNIIASNCDGHAGVNQSAKQNEITQHNRLAWHEVCAAFPLPDGPRRGGREHGCDVDADQTAEQMSRTAAQCTTGIAINQRPLRTWDGQCVEGRSRQHWAQQAGITLAIRPWRPRRHRRSVLRQIVQLNLRWQPLRSGQRAAVAALLVDAFAREIESRTSERKTRNADRLSGSASAGTEQVNRDDRDQANAQADAMYAGATTSDPLGRGSSRLLDGEDSIADIRAMVARARSPLLAAARAFGIDQHDVTNARYIRSHRPDLFMQLHAGYITLFQAKRELERTRRGGHNIADTTRQPRENHQSGVLINAGGSSQPWPTARQKSVSTPG